MTELRGMTWDHPRGYDPLAACAALWRRQGGAAITWDRRSLQDFESYPVEDLARRYDLIVIDHPHVGQITREDCLLPLDTHARAADLAQLARQSVGPSFESYRWQGRLWALPIDAATQVQAWRPDRMAAPPRDWAAMMDLARSGRVLCPLRPPHSLMVFCTLAANLGWPCAAAGSNLFIGTAQGIAVFARMRALAACLDPACFAMDPIDVYECLARPDATAESAPLIYGYVNYASAGFRPARLAFADIPAAGTRGPAGTVLGGTGIAVSRYCAAPQAATEFAFWVAGAEIQRGPYAAAGGQPGNAAAWDDPANDEAAGGFYSSTRATLDGAWVRPRHDGYMAFQQRAAERITAGLREGLPGDEVVADLNTYFADSLQR